MRLKQWKTSVVRVRRLGVKGDEDMSVYMRPDYKTWIWVPWRTGSKSMAQVRSFNKVRWELGVPHTDGKNYISG